MKPDDIDPAVKRSLAESVAHHGEARRQLTELAKSRGAPVPRAPQSLPNEWQEELTPIQNDVEELKRQMKPGLSVRAPGGTGFRVGGLHGWQAMIILISAFALAAWTWVQTHTIKIATPVTQPTPAPRSS